jgi:hypothetical protein
MDRQKIAAPLHPRPHVLQKPVSLATFGSGLRHVQRAASITTMHDLKVQRIVREFG